jgi:hypothetical protein
MADTTRKTPARGGRAADLAEAPPDPMAGVPYRIADHDLFIYHPDSGALPARAFNAGDRVPADMVDAYGWQDLTHPPEWATAPPAPASRTGPDKGGSEE